jgi:hypothetical protein
MARNRWLAAVLALGFVLVWAEPAAAQCIGSKCYRYYADITIAVTASPSSPVLPSSTHTYTVSVTNTGWVGYLNYPPVPGPSIASGHVYVVIQPSSLDEFPVANRNISGVGFPCTGYHGGLVCDALSLPTNSTSQFAVDFQAPATPGSYSCHSYADSQGWDEYNSYNNDVTLDYQVDVPALPRPLVVTAGR